MTDAFSGFPSTAGHLVYAQLFFNQMTECIRMFSNHNQKLLSAYLHDSHNNNGFPSFYYILGQEEGKEGKNGRLLRGCLL